MPKEYDHLIKYFSTPDVRTKCHNLHENDYVLASLSQNNRPSSGWHDLNAICKRSSLSGSNKQTRLMKHLGHSSEIHNGIEFVQ